MKWHWIFFEWLWECECEKYFPIENKTDKISLDFFERLWECECENCFSIKNKTDEITLNFLNDCENVKAKKFIDWKQNWWNDFEFLNDCENVNAKKGFRLKTKLKNVFGFFVWFLDCECEKCFHIENNTERMILNFLCDCELWMRKMFSSSKQNWQNGFGFFV